MRNLPLGVGIAAALLVAVAGMGALVSPWWWLLGAAGAFYVGRDATRQVRKARR